MIGRLEIAFGTGRSPPHRIFIASCHSLLEPIWDRGELGRSSKSKTDRLSLDTAARGLGVTVLEQQTHQSEVAEQREGDGQNGQKQEGNRSPGHGRALVSHCGPSCRWANTRPAGRGVISVMALGGISAGVSLRRAAVIFHSIHRPSKTPVRRLSDRWVRVIVARLPRLQSGRNSNAVCSRPTGKNRVRSHSQLPDRVYTVGPK